MMACRHRGYKPAVQPPGLSVRKSTQRCGFRRMGADAPLLRSSTRAPFLYPSSPLPALLSSPPAAMRFYQLQGLQWMTDQELGPGGIARHLYAPIKLADDTVLYYSFLLNSFRRTPPPPIRGGMLCDEMGLGKTIVTLGLVLSNPAKPVWVKDPKVDAELLKASVNPVHYPATPFPAMIRTACNLPSTHGITLLLHGVTVRAF